MEDPYLDMKQFIQAVIRRYQRVAFGWMMVQVRAQYIPTYNDKCIH